MKVLVLGGGGREHALVRALNLSKKFDKVYCAPGGDGIAKEAEFISFAESETHDIAEKAVKHGIDLVVVGPEKPLADGVADSLREHGVAVFGPSKEGAELEASKIAAKRFMSDARVPTSAFEEVNDVDEVMKAVDKFTPPYVLKFDGLAGGKGVFICETKEELQQNAEKVFNSHSVSDISVKTALMEQYQDGWELSYLVVTNGKDYQALPLCQDHKRLKEDDQGPNTGGMGAVGPIELDPDLKKKIDEKIVKPSVARLKDAEILFRGILYIGIMVTKEGPKVLEYNVRFGDPECQVIMPLLDGDWGEVFWEVAQGNLPELKWKDQFASCVVLASAGYPENPKKGVPIKGKILAKNENAYFLHAGVLMDPNDGWVTSGGRVLNAIGLGATLQESLDNAYALADTIKCEGMQMRRDIGKKQL